MNEQDFVESIRRLLRHGEIPLILRVRDLEDPQLKTFRTLLKIQREVRACKILFKFLVSLTSIQYLKDEINRSLALVKYVHLRVLRLIKKKNYQSEEGDSDADTVILDSDDVFVISILKPI